MVNEMTIDFTAQTAPFLWAIVAALLILALVLFASLDPELAEVYFGDLQLLVATVALAAIAVAMLVSGHGGPRDLAPFLAGR